MLVIYVFISAFVKSFFLQKNNHFAFLLKIIKRQRIPKGQSKMDNPEKRATYGAQDEDKQNKNTTQNELSSTICKHTHIT